MVRMVACRVEDIGAKTWKKNRCSNASIHFIKCSTCNKNDIVLPSHQRRRRIPIIFRTNVVIYTFKCKTSLLSCCTWICRRNVGCSKAVLVNLPETVLSSTNAITPAISIRMLSSMFKQSSMLLIPGIKFELWYSCLFFDSQRRPRICPLEKAGEWGCF